MIRLRAVVGGWLIATLVCASSACGTDAVGIDTCRRIEQARCRKAPSCPSLGLSNVETCVAFARDRCLHGLPVAEPSAARVDQCVSAIEQATTCAVVETPEADPACAFLGASGVGDGGSSDADAAETTEASDPNDANHESDASDASASDDARAANDVGAPESSATDDAAGGG